MKEYTVGSESSGQRLDRYIRKILPEIPGGLLQKSIRKKNITLNGKKAEARRVVKTGDNIQVYFSDKTIQNFEKENKLFRTVPPELSALIINPAYENDDYIVLNKPAGLLSQPDATETLSISDLIPMRFSSCQETFHPAPLNRLDRNTSGIIIIPKNYASQKKASSLIRKHQAQKIYLTLALGEVSESGVLINNYQKLENQNTATLNGDKEIRLEYFPICTNGKMTLLGVKLITGKSHQIRVQLSGADHPIVGDPKYGNKELNQKMKEKYNLSRQLLHAWRYVLNDGTDQLLDARAPLPKEFREILEKEFDENIDGILEKAASLEGKFS